MEYEACVTGTAHLDLPLQVPCFTWKEGWFAVFKKHIPPGHKGDHGEAR
jgi:hypothetical protein